MEKNKKNIAKRKRTGGKHQVQVPWNTAEIANDLYSHRKGQAKRIRHARKIKKIMKMVEVQKTKQENEDMEIGPDERDNLNS